MKDVGLRLRVEKELREEFLVTCRLQGRHTAEVLRAFMRDYITRECGGMQASLFQGAALERGSTAIRPRRRKNAMREFIRKPTRKERS